MNDEPIKTAKEKPEPSAATSFVRQRALELALGHHGEGNGTPEELVSTANTFLGFLSNSTEIAK